MSTVGLLAWFAARSWEADAWQDSILSLIDNKVQWTFDFVACVIHDGSAPQVTSMTTACLLAAHYGTIPVLQYCLDRHHVAMKYLNNGNVCFLCPAPALAHEGDDDHDPDRPDHYSSPVNLSHAAAAGGSVEVTKFLLQRGLDLGGRDEASLISVLRPGCSPGVHALLVAHRI